MATKKTHEPLTTQARIGIHEHHAPLSEWPNSCFLVEWLNSSFGTNYSFEHVRDHSTRVCFCICHLWTLPLSTWWWWSHGGRLLSSTVVFWTIFGLICIYVFSVIGWCALHKHVSCIQYLRETVAFHGGKTDSRSFIQFFWQIIEHNVLLIIRVEITHTSRVMNNSIQNTLSRHNKHVLIAGKA